MAKAVPGASLSDILKYADLVGKVIFLVKQAEGLDPGASMDLDDLKFKVKGKRYNLHEGVLTREG